jgi:heavy metal sensor kinase
MNTKSIRFRLTAWYAGLLTCVMVLFGIFIYFTLDQFLERNLRDSLRKQAQTIGETLLRELAQNGDDYVVGEIDEHFAPRITGQFIRVTRSNGSVLYQSGTPHNREFDPASVSLQRPDAFKLLREEHLANGRELLIYSLPFFDAVGDKYLIETGAPYEQLERVLHGLVLSLVIAFPVILAVAIGGGYFFMRKALTPLDEIVTTAEKITSRNLNERVPVPATGDELEKLSLSLNRMMARLEESFHHINRFSADAAHEIRTPLAIIRGELENALQVPGISNDLRETLASALEEAERLSRIAEQLLEMSRLEAGETLIEQTLFDLTEMTKSTVEQMRLLAEEKAVRLKFEGQQEVQIDGDPIRLKQIVVNLVDNAIKYTASGGSVYVSTFPVDGKAVLEVADTGIGIPEDSLHQVFNRFYRVDKARSRQLGGTGLGLAIVKSICTAYGGTIGVKSAEGQGTIFRVELPLTPANGM